MSKSLAYTIGVYLAGRLIRDHIPSLSCNQCTRNVEQVTWGEAQEYKRLHDAWFSKVNQYKHDNPCDKGMSGKGRYQRDQDAYDYAEDEWNAQMKYRYMLKEKYLPHKIRPRIPYIDFSDEEVNKEIKKGLIDTLWDWDFCEWSLKEEDIIFENKTDKFGDNDEYSYSHAFVTLKLDLEAPGSFTGDSWIEIKTPQKK